MVDLLCVVIRSFLPSSIFILPSIEHRLHLHYEHLCRVCPLLIDFHYSYHVLVTSDRFLTTSCIFLCSQKDLYCIGAFPRYGTVILDSAHSIQTHSNSHTTHSKIFEHTHIIAPHSNCTVHTSEPLDTRGWF